MSRAGELRAERARLLARAAAERESIRAQLRAWEAPLALVDRTVATARHVHRHPQWLIAVAVVLAVVRPRRALAWVRNGLVAWRALRWVSAWRDHAVLAHEGRAPAHVPREPEALGNALRAGREGA